MYLYHMITLKRASHILQLLCTRKRLLALINCNVISYNYYCYYDPCNVSSSNNETSDDTIIIFHFCLRPHFSLSSVLNIKFFFWHDTDLAVWWLCVLHYAQAKEKYFHFYSRSNQHSISVAFMLTFSISATQKKKICNNLTTHKSATDGH